MVELDDTDRGLLTIPGIGKILTMTIMLEAGDIRRFEIVGHDSSYCRCVKAQGLSNGKKKGNNHRKKGNRYLAWAYVEAANHNKRRCSQARNFVERKIAEKNDTVAIKALANKLSKASLFLSLSSTIKLLQKIFRIPLVFVRQIRSSGGQKKLPGFVSLSGFT